jgi:dihydroorotate dehydrogenase subfamily 2
MLVLNPDTFKAIIRPLMSGMSPESAHGFAHALFKRTALWKTLSPALRVQNGRLEVNVGGLWLENPVGLAAGYDKDCDSLAALSNLGFGYVTGGTVTESPRPGNPSPRLIRYDQDEALINSMGFPGRGLEHAAARLESLQSEPRSAAYVVSVSGITPGEIINCHHTLEPLVDAVEINISSPNTLGLRVFQEPVALGELLDGVNEGRNKPLFVKLPTYLSPNVAPSSGRDARERVLQLAHVCVQKGVTALTVANTWPARDSRLAVGSGGLSGRVVFPDMINMVRDIRSEVGSGIAINACGGIFSGEDAWEAIEAGANTVQLYTALVYRGPGIVKRINKELVEIMDAYGVGSLSLGAPAARVHA